MIISPIRILIGSKVLEKTKKIWDKVWNDAKCNYFIEVHKEISKSLIQKGSLGYERFKRHVSGRPDYYELQDLIVRDIPKSAACLKKDKFQESIMKEETVKVKDYYSKRFSEH